jgi:hypothetical protein
MILVSSHLSPVTEEAGYRCRRSLRVLQLGWEHVAVVDFVK